MNRRTILGVVAGAAELEADRARAWLEPQHPLAAGAAPLAALVGGGHHDRAPAHGALGAQLVGPDRALLVRVEVALEVFLSQDAFLPSQAAPVALKDVQLPLQSVRPGLAQGILHDRAQAFPLYPGDLFGFPGQFRWQGYSFLYRGTH